MFHSILGFVMELSLVYLLIAVFVILDLLLLSSRARRLRSEKMDGQRRDERREADGEQQRKAFESRQAYVRAAH